VASSSLTNVLIIGTVIFAIAMIIPIFFDVDFPQRGDTITFVDKAICTIIPNGGGNYTCLTPDDTVFFNGTGLTITANDTERTVFFAVDANGTITTCSNIGPGFGICSGPVFSTLEFKSLVAGTDINITSDANSLTIDFAGTISAGENTTATSLGGDTDVFESQVGDQLRFRGLTAGQNIILTQNANDIVINSTDTSGVKFAILTAGGATLQTPASSTPQRDTQAGTNFDYLALEYDATTSEEVVWQYQFPTDADGTQNVNVLIRFLTPTGSAGGVCFSGQFLGRANTEPYDVAMGTTITGCDTTLDTAGDINEITLTFTTGQHGLTAGDTVVFKLARDTANGSDTHAGDAWYIDSRVTWS